MTSMVFPFLLIPLFRNSPFQTLLLKVPFHKKGKFAPAQDIKADKECRGITPLILILCNRWK